MLAFRRDNGQQWCFPRDTAPSYVLQAAFKFVRNISLAFRSDQLAPVDYPAKWKEYEKKHGPGSYDALSRNQRTAEAHDWAHEDSCFLEWGGMLEKLDLFERGMNFIHVNFKHAFCSTGCCRIDLNFIEYLLHEVEPESIGISGLMFGEEDELLDNLGFEHGGGQPLTLEGFKSKYNVRFIKSD